MEPRVWLAEQKAEEALKELSSYVPDPESYPGYGWGWHGPWDDEY